jgi:epsin
MEMLDKRLNDKGKNWRHVFKVCDLFFHLAPLSCSCQALTVIDYCLHAGSENVVIYWKDNVYIIKTLKEFQFIDEYEKDQGANVRQKAKDITNLLSDETRLREARRNRASMRDRMLRGEPGSEYGQPSEFDENSSRREPAPRPRKNREEDELKRALEESKAQFSKEQSKGMTAEERDLAAAIKLSQEEEEKRKRAAEDANAKSLFDDT